VLEEDTHHTIGNDLPFHIAVLVKVQFADLDYTRKLFHLEQERIEGIKVAHHLQL
jgi:hypothetical protein